MLYFFWFKSRVLFFDAVEAHIKPSSFKGPIWLVFHGSKVLKGSKVIQ